MIPNKDGPVAVVVGPRARAVLPWLKGFKPRARQHTQCAQREKSRFCVLAWPTLGTISEDTARAPSVLVRSARQGVASRMPRHWRTEPAHLRNLA